MTSRFSSLPRLAFVTVLIFFFSFTVGYVYVHELVHEFGGIGVSEVCYFGHRADDPQSMGWTIAFKFGATELFGLDAGFLIGVLVSVVLITFLLCMFAWLERHSLPSSPER